MRITEEAIEAALIAYHHGLGIKTFPQASKDKMEAALCAADLMTQADNDLATIKTFWRAEPSCIGLNCVAECDPMTAHCGRAVELFAEHNARVNDYDWTLPRRPPRWWKRLFNRWGWG